VDSEGRTFRPDLLLVDDPQDRESARSVTQTAERLALLNGDLLGLAGPGERIAALTTCTIIFKGDLADQLLDPALNPAWQGETYKLVYRWPDRDDLWQTYLDLRDEGRRPGGDRSAATEFYRANREAMDEGAVVAWPERYEPGELSAIQHAYDRRQDLKEDAFMSEYQNEPSDPARQADALDAASIAARCVGFPRGVAPPEAEKLTGFVDVGQTLLWWMVCYWDTSFGCSVVDYGCWPEQRGRVFASRNASPTLRDFYPGATSNEAAVYSGLTEVVGRLFAGEWRRSDGATLTLSRVPIDAGWATETVRLFVRQSPHKDRLTPAKGVGIGPGQTAIADYRKRPGERLGDGWILGAAGPDRLRLLRFDSNFWKTRAADMLTRPMGQKGGVTLPGDRPAEHELLCLHLASEYPTATEAKGNAVNVWARRPDRENHLWDTLVGNAVAASLEGLSPLAAFGGGVKPPPKRRRMSMAEMQRAAMEKRTREGRG
jgi:hypothetical protein